MCVVEVVAVVVVFEAVVTVVAVVCLCRLVDTHNDCLDQIYVSVVEAAIIVVVVVD